MKASIAKSGCRILPLALAALGLAGGCRTISKGITESVLQRGSTQWRVHYGSRTHYTLTDKTMRQIQFEGSRNATNTVVRYQWGLGEQAQCIADVTDKLLGEVEQRLGMDITTRTIAYLLRFDERPENFDIVLRVEPNEFPLPLFVRAGEESCAAILTQNDGYPYLLVHELVETSLASGGSELNVLPDLAWGAFGLNLQLNNYTRWFREGLANYAGYLAHELISAQISPEQRLHHRQALIHVNPFSSLAQVGDKLFSWPQTSNVESERDNYNAALGLFLLIVDNFGEQAIRDIMAEVARREAVDGQDLIEITNRVIDADVRQLARDFRFRTIGAEVERMSPALAANKGLELREGLFVQTVNDESVAKRAGLHETDVITAVGSTPVGNPLDFELGLFRTRKATTVPLTVHRAGAGTLTLELSFIESKPPEKDTPEDRRRKPLEKAG
jgi:hypothetical protein